MNRSLTLVGMGEDGFDGLSEAARTLVRDADIVIGSKRLLQLLPPLKAALHTWPSPFDSMIERIRGWSGKRVVILATGDPMNYGIGALLAPRLKEDLRIIPSPSAFSLAAARMGWALPEVDLLSLHGRNAALLEPLVSPRARILALTAGEETVRAVADLLVRRNYATSLITVLEHMGGPRERRLSFEAQSPVTGGLADLSTIAIECRAGQGAALLARVPGLPDDAFVHDGQLTKREVRSITLSALAPVPNAVLWDIGAGCGSISIEWMRAARGAMAIAFEPSPDRCGLIAENAVALGTPDLKIVKGRAPASLENQNTPDAVFHGGAVSDDEIFEHAWLALPSSGRFVANAVTLEGETALVARQHRYGGEIVRLEVSQLVPMGSKRGMRPRMAVTQWRIVKP